MASAQEEQDFAAQLTEAAGVEAPNEASEDRPRNEDGTFAAAPEETGTAETEEAVEEALLAGKYKTTQDLENAYKQLETKLGEMSAEVADSRAEDDDEVPELDSGTILGIINDYQDQGKYQEAAVYALNNGLYDTPIYNKVMDTWADAFPRQATRFESRLDMLHQRQEFEQRLAPVTQQTTETQFNQAWNKVSERNPDLKDFADEIMAAAQTAPEIVATLRSGDAESKERVIENLYWMARGRKADTLADAASSISSSQQEEARRAKAEASVASAESTTPRGDQVTTPQERMKAGFDAIGGSMWDSFTSRDTRQ